MPEHRLRWAAPLSLAVALLWGSGLANRAVASDPTPAAAIADLNAWRAEAGESPVQLRYDWNQGCQLHDEYMASTGDYGHSESPGSPWYTAAGADTGQNSVLVNAQLLPSAAWKDAVYHRGDLLNPRLSVSGYDASGGYTCMRVFGGVDDSPTGQTASLVPSPWPPNAAQNVPTTFSGNEEPNPRALDPNGGDLGYLLSVDFNGPWSNSSAAEATVGQASLTADSTGASVALVHDSLIGVPGFGLFPVDPLQPGISYTAHVTGGVRDGTTNTTYPFDVSWQFRTAQAPDAPLPATLPTGPPKKHVHWQHCGSSAKPAHRWSDLHAYNIACGGARKVANGYSVADHSPKGFHCENRSPRTAATRIRCAHGAPGNQQRVSFKYRN